MEKCLLRTSRKVTVIIRSVLLGDCLYTVRVTQTFSLSKAKIQGRDVGWDVRNKGRESWATGTAHLEEKWKCARRALQLLCTEKEPFVKFLYPVAWKSRAAHVAELPLSLPGSAKGCWIKKESYAHTACTQSLTATPAAFPMGILTLWTIPPFFQHTLLSVLLTREKTAFLTSRQEVGRPGHSRKGSQGIQWARCMSQNCCAPWMKAQGPLSEIHHGISLH